jgi:hypothetical protein
MMQLLNYTADTNSGPMVTQSLFAETERLGYWHILGSEEQNKITSLNELINYRKYFCLLNISRA